MTENIIELLTKHAMINWNLQLLQKSKVRDAQNPSQYGIGMATIHPFCLDFSSALLANLLHAQSTLELLESNPRMTQDVMNSLLALLNDDDAQGNVLVKPEDRVTLPTSTIIH